MQTLEQNNTTKLLVAAPVAATIITFVISTFMFGLLLTGQKHVPSLLQPVFHNIFGITVLSFLLNGVVFAIIFLASFYHREHQRQILWHLSLMLINIPLALIYIIIYSNIH